MTCVAQSIVEIYSFEIFAFRNGRNFCWDLVIAPTRLRESNKVNKIISFPFNLPIIVFIIFVIDEKLQIDVDNSVGSTCTFEYVW